MKLIKNTIFDIIKLYKNFFRWNISKLLIVSYSALLAFVFTIPIILIIFVYGHFASISFLELFEQILLRNFGADNFVNIMLIIWWVTYVFMYLYQHVLLVKLGMKIDEGKKIKFFNKDYYNFWVIKRYIYLNFINVALLIIPVLFFALFIWIINNFVWWIEAITNFSDSKMMLFWIITIIWFLFSLLLFLYIFYRVCFSYFMLIWDKHFKQKTIAYFKKSIISTKGFKNFFRFLSVILLFLLVLFPFKFIKTSQKESALSISNFLAYDSFNEDEKAMIMKEKAAYIQWLQLKYANINRWDLERELTSIEYWMILINILQFLFLYWVIDVVLLSFYKNIIIKHK